jgi:hypothetical protein
MNIDLILMDIRYHGEDLGIECMPGLVIPKAMGLLRTDSQG